MRLKLFIVAAIVLLSVADVKSQDFYAGPQLGLAFSQLDGDSYGGYHKFGLAAGGFVGRKVSRNFDLQLELMYVEKGSRETPDVENGYYEDYLLELKYLQFPLMGIYHLRRFNLEAGVSYGRLISSYEERDGNPQDSNPFNDDEWGAIIGFSFKINDKLSFNSRYSSSIAMIREPFEGDLDVYNPHWGRKPGQYNNTITVSLFYNLYTSR